MAAWLIQPSGSLSAALRTGIASFAAGPISPRAVSDVLRTLGHLSLCAAFARAGTAVAAHFGPMRPRASAAATRVSLSRRGLQDLDELGRGGNGRAPHPPQGADRRLPRPLVPRVEERRR